MKVHLFPLVSDLYEDTRLPLQYPGNGQQPAPKQVTLALLLTWIQARVGVKSQLVTVSGNTYAYTIQAGVWLVAYAIEGPTSFTFNVGNSAGGNDITFEGTHTGGQPDSFPLSLYGGDGGKTIYFSGLSGTNDIIFLTNGTEI